MRQRGGLVVGRCIGSPQMRVLCCAVLCCNGWRELADNMLCLEEEVQIKLGE